MVWSWCSCSAHQVFDLKGDKHAVTCLSLSPNGEQLAAGYSDGAVKLGNLQTGEAGVAFS